MQGDFTFSAEQAADLLFLFRNSTRIAILSLLRDREWDVGSLADAVDLSQSAISQQLKRMRDLGVVSTRRDAQTVYYRCSDDRVLRLLSMLERMYVHSQPLPSAA